MALIKCPECGRENVSSTAKSCPGCGYPIKMKSGKRCKIFFVSIGIAVIVLAVSIALLGSRKNEMNNKEDITIEKDESPSVELEPISNVREDESTELMAESPKEVDNPVFQLFTEINESKKNLGDISSEYKSGFDHAYVIEIHREKIMTEKVRRAYVEELYKLNQESLDQDIVEILASVYNLYLDKFDLLIDADFEAGLLGDYYDQISEINSKFNKEFIVLQNMLKEKGYDASVYTSKYPADMIVTDAELNAIGESRENPALSEATLGEKNALEAAKSYLAITSFSYTGLIEQLKYEGYTENEAIYGADHCGTDWNLQAYYHAQSYLEIMAFSREGLIEQLEHDGFTSEQANYGVTRAGF